MTNTPPCPWKVGDKVQRKPGASYLFPGVIISTGLKLDGKTWHCEVECIAPGVEGCTHVFPASQLVPLDPGYLTRANADARLVEALRDILDAVGALTNVSEFPNCLNLSEERGREILALLAAEVPHG